MGTNTRQLFTESLSNMIRGLSQYAMAHKLTYQSPLAEDQVLGMAWLDAVKGLWAMLKGERGYHDGGTLDKAIRAMVEEAGFDPNLL